MSNFFCEHKVFFRTFAFGLAFLFLILSFPSSAVDYIHSRVFVGASDFISSDSLSSSVDYSSGFALFTRSDGSDVRAWGASAPLYFTLRSTSNSSSSGVSLCVYSLTRGATLYNSYGSSTYFVSADNYDSTTGFYWGLQNAYAASIPFTFSNVSVWSNTAGPDALASDLLLWLNSSPSSNGFLLEYDLPPGNVLFARLATDDYDLTLSAQFESWSDLISGTFNRNPFYYGFTDAVPNTSTVFPADYMSQHFLYKSGSQNLLGQSQSGSFYTSSSATEQFLVIYNPVSIHTDTGSISSYIPEDVTLHITLVSAVSAYAFPLNSSFSISGGVTGSSDFTADEEYSIEYDEDSGSWVTSDSDGNAAVLPDGGYNDLSPDTSSIKGILQNFVRNFTGIFEKSYSAISGLISAGSAFISRLGGMFAWLPADVYSVLSSALLLVVVIGVIKVLL